MPQHELLACAQCGCFAFSCFEDFAIRVNNAGISIRHAFLDITKKQWHDVLAVNLTGVFHVAQTAARHMIEQGGGVILNTASTSGTHGYPYYADYNATKAGVIALTKSMGKASSTAT